MTQAPLEVGLDTLIPFGLDIGQRRVDFSLYIIGRHYFRELVFDQVLVDPLIIQQEGEVGITFGSNPLPRIWKLNIPRLLIGYRFAENFPGSGNIRPDHVLVDLQFADAFQ